MRRQLRWPCHPLDPKVTQYRTITHEITFRFDEQPADEAYVARYRVGATESQDERPWEDEDTITAIVVRHVERMVKVWEPVEEPSPSVAS